MTFGLQLCYKGQRIKVHVCIKTVQKKWEFWKNIREENFTSAWKQNCSQFRVTRSLEGAPAQNPCPDPHDTLHKERYQKVCHVYLFLFPINTYSRALWPLIVNILKWIMEMKKTESEERSVAMIAGPASLWWWQERAASPSMHQDEDSCNTERRLLNPCNFIQRRRIYVRRVRHSHEATSF